jgi:hypothetical protein
VIRRTVTAAAGAGGATDRASRGGRGPQVPSDQRWSSVIGWTGLLVLIHDPLINKSIERVTGSDRELS